MTDLEISKALALTIGWTEDKMIRDGDKLRCYRGERQWGWQVFDYRDWNIIGPIAEVYDAFPMKAEGAWWCRGGWSGIASTGDTPQKAIALAVIEGAKK